MEHSRVLKKLTTLWLNDNKIIEIGDSIIPMKELKNIRVSRNQIKRVNLIKVMILWPKLSNLELMSNKLSYLPHVNRDVCEGRNKTSSVAISFAGNRFDCSEPNVLFSGFQTKTGELSKRCYRKAVMWKQITDGWNFWSRKCQRFLGW